MSDNYLFIKSAINKFQLLTDLYDNNEQELNDMFGNELGILTHDDINMLQYLQKKTSLK